MEDKDFKYKKIYFVGIKGVGMASLAVIAKQAGMGVRGSDVDEAFITDEMLIQNGIKVDVNFLPESVADYASNNAEKTLVIYSAAHNGKDNEQVKWADENEVETLSFGEALGKFQTGELLNRNDIRGISVAGSHGKTTTTAMLATVLQKLGDDPSYLIGTSDVKSLGDAGHYGRGKYFITESDEFFSDIKYDRSPKFLHQYPYASIITNVDFDHPDVFDDLESVYSAFEKFADNISPGGVLVISGDNAEYERIYKQTKDEVNIVTFGQSENNNYRAVNIKNSQDGVTYTVIHKGNSLGEVTLPVIGAHNAINSLSVVALLHFLQFPIDKIIDGLRQYQGAKRRMEIKGESSSGALVIDDYAHHPAEIKATLSAINDAYEDRKIICVFQPHTLSRTEKLIDDFKTAFQNLEELVLLPIFPSAREGKVDEVRQKKLYDQIINNNSAIFIENSQSVLEYLTQNYNSKNYIILTMGAGNVYKIANELVNK